MLDMHLFSLVELSCPLKKLLLVGYKHFWDELGIIATIIPNVTEYDNSHFYNSVFKRAYSCLHYIRYIYDMGCHLCLAIFTMVTAMASFNRILGRVSLKLQSMHDNTEGSKPGCWKQAKQKDCSQQNKKTAASKEFHWAVLGHSQLNTKQEGNCYNHPKHPSQANK